MERITELFNIYKDNITWIRKIESKLQENLPIDEWCQGLPEINREYKIRYDQNDGIVEEIMEMISGELSDEVCDKLYFECKKMYEEYIDDGFFLVKIFEKLILHYEKIGDNIAYEGERCDLQFFFEDGIVTSIRYLAHD